MTDEQLTYEGEIKLIPSYTFWERILNSVPGLRWLVSPKYRRFKRGIVKIVRIDDDGTEKTIYER
jgi:hypothetical protein